MIQGHYYQAGSAQQSARGHSRQQSFDQAYITDEQFEASLRQLGLDRAAKMRPLSHNETQQALAVCMERQSSNSSSSSSGSSQQSNEGYLCLEPGCNGKIFKRHYDLNRHAERLHRPSPKLYDCPYCDRQGSRGLPRKDKLIEHIRTTHHIPIPKRPNGGRRASTGYGSPYF